MKYKTVLKNLTLFMLVVCIMLVSLFSASAVDDTSENINSQVETQGDVQEETTSESETEVVTEETQPTTEEQAQTPTQESQQNEPNTDNYEENITDDPQSEVKETQTETKENKQEVNDTIQTKTLPTVATETEKKVVNKDDLTYGYVSWACVAAGILVLLIVFISIKSSGIKQSKRKRR